MTLARFRPAWESSTARFQPAWEAAAADVAVTLDHNIDTGNIDPATVSITDATTTTPTIYASAGRADTSGWIHFLFALDDADGKRPFFELNDNRSFNWTLYSTWRPLYTYDFVTWHQAPSFTRADDKYSWQFTEAFNQNRVYIACYPTYTVGMFDELRTELAALPQVSPAPDANASGILGTTVAETNNLSTAVGGNSLHGLKIDWGGSTTDGNPKRVMTLFAGVHPGEVVDGWVLRGFLDWVFDDASTEAQRFRSNFVIYLYFGITPNGRKGGHRRTNFRNSTDPNRVWKDGDFSLTESQIYRDSVLQATTSNWDAHLDLHSFADRSTPFLIFSQDNDSAAVNAYNSAVGETHTLGSPTLTSIVGTTAYWAGLQGATVAVTVEAQQRGPSALSGFTDFGEALALGLAKIDADGVFYAPPEGTGTITGNGTLAGTGETPAVAVTEGTGTITGNGTLAGTGETPRNGTGTITGSGALSGIGETPFVGQNEGTGTITGSGTLAGTGETLRNGTGTITGSGALSGTGETPLVAATEGTGTITGSGALAGIGETPAVAVTEGTGTITGNGALSGTGESPFVGQNEGTGAITGGGNIIGLGRFPAQGTGTITGSGTLSGTGETPAVAATEGTGTITGSGALAGIGETPLVGESNGTGTITGGGNIIGVGRFAPQGTGSISGAGTLSGTGEAPVVAATEGTGTITGSGALAGTGETPEVLESEGTGSLSGGGNIIGIGRFAPQGTGTLTGNGSLVGVGETPFIWLIGRAVRPGAKDVTAQPGIIAVSEQPGIIAVSEQPGIKEVA